jgi:hypothetical protein
MTACNRFIGSDQLQVDRAEGSGAVLGRDGVVHRAAGNIFELLISDLCWLVGIFAHIRLGVWFLVVGSRMPRSRDYSVESGPKNVLFSALKKPPAMVSSSASERFAF